MKYLGTAISFAEFPDEISLCLNITNCPNCCKHCSEPELKEDIGEELTISTLDEMIAIHKGITLIGFMGGDRYHHEMTLLAQYIKNTYNLKVGIYSGLDILDSELLSALDYYKIGRWIMPEGPVENWWKTSCGPIKFTFSNQLMFKKVDNNWVNITDKFRNKPLNNLKKEIV